MPRLEPARALIVFMLISYAASSFGGALDPIQKDLRSGRVDRALSRVETLLDDEPDRADARLLKAEILRRTGREQEAIRLLESLISKHPGLIAAYNNLAVIYAERGKLDKARQTLEKGVKSNEVFATLHGNLSSIYESMAQEAYGRALDLKTNATQIKLATVLDVESAKPEAPHKTRSVAPKRVARANKQSPRALAEPRPKAVKPTTAAAKPQTRRSESNPWRGKQIDGLSLDQGIGRKQPVSDTPELIASIPRSAEPPPPPAPAESPIPASVVTPVMTGKAEPEPVDREVLRTRRAVGPIRRLLGWARAWSKQDPNAYMGFYSNGYHPADMTRKAWKAQRRTRLTRPEWIEVELGEFRAKPLDDGKVEIEFRQQYRSDRFKSDVRKRVVMINQGEGWVIASEKVTERL